MVNNRGHGHKSQRLLVVLEARDRIGGRIWTSTAWPGAPMDLGASWIHGIDGNPIHELAQKVGVKTVPTSGDSITYYLPDGRETDDEQGRRLEYWGARAAEAVTRYQDDEDTDASIRTAVRASIDPDTLTGLDPALVSYNLNEYEHEYAGSVDELSALHFDSDAPLKGDDVLFPGGYQQLTDHLATGLDIRTGHTVTRVEWDGTGVTVTTDKGAFRAGKVVVTLNDGSVITDEIAVADAHPLGACPFGREQYVAKFRTLAEGVVSQSEQDRFLGLIERLPTLKAGDLSGLTFTVESSRLASAKATGIFDWRGEPAATARNLSAVGE